MEKERLDSQNQDRPKSPRPPVLPRSFQNKQGISSVDKPSLQNENERLENKPKEKSFNQDVIISEPKTPTIENKKSRPVKGSLDKKAILKAVGIVIIFVFIIAGVFTAIVLKSMTNVAADITSLNENSAGLTNLNSFVKYKNLEEIRLYNNHINDISAIKELKKLKTVYLRQNDISDISALASLKDIEYLHLENNNITDISALASLTKLRVLYIGKNNISDLSPLENLVNLEELDLSFNQIEDISALSKLTKLRRLKLNNNQIDNVSALKDLKELRDLYLRDNKDIKDLTALLGLHKMEWASFNPISLELDIIYELKEANPDAIYYFYYAGEYLTTREGFVYDPHPPEENNWIVIN